MLHANNIITLNQTFLLPSVTYKVPAILSCTSTKQTKIKNQVTKCTTKTGHETTGFNNFVRENPNSYKFMVINFHHIEFWCNDATNTARRFSWGLGMPIVSKSDLSTGNLTHASYLLTSGEVNFLFTAPYSPTITTNVTTTSAIPTFSYTDCRNFTASHGLAVRAIAIEVEDAELAFNVSVANGARPSSLPVILGDSDVVLAEVKLYGDVVLRYISYKKNKDVTFLPLFEHVEKTSSFPELDYGIRSLDHVAGNVQKLAPVVEYVKLFTGFHEFAEFMAEDFKKIESGTNSVVLACNNENVLMSMNEPVYGTKRKSNIQTYLEHNEGAGVHHLALATEDIFRTLKEMRKRSGVGGFEFMSAPPPTYYQNLKKRVGDVLSDEQILECEELGVLVDKDDQGTLLQIFTKPVGDRPTVFIEIIQRIGCMVKDDEGKLQQKSGCGGFGKGNFNLSSSLNLLRNMRRHLKHDQPLNQLPLHENGALKILFISSDPIMIINICVCGF